VLVWGVVLVWGLWPVIIVVLSWGQSVLSRRLVWNQSWQKQWQLWILVYFAKMWVFFDIILEGDALQIVLEINSGSHSLSRFGQFIDNIKHELSYFNFVIFVHVPRELNSVAHVLANEVPLHCLEHVWLEETPFSISDVVLREQVCP
jgi:hypothetical protein